MSRGRTILAALVAAALAWAYVVAHRSTPAPGLGMRQVPVWSIEAGALRQLSYRDGENQVSMTIDWPAGGGEPYLWIESRSAPATAPSQPNASQTTSQRAFKGNALARTVLDWFTQLRARRALGRADALDLTPFELATPNRYVELSFADGREPWRLYLGRLIFGGAMRYARTSQQGAAKAPAGGKPDGAVYLIEENPITNFAASTMRMYDPQVLAVPFNAAHHITVKAGATSHTLWRVSSADGRRSYWSDRKGGAEESEAAAELVNQMSRLRAMDYLPKGTPTGPAPVLEVLIYREEDEQDSAWLRVYAPGKDNHIAQSSYTRAPVRIAEALAKAVLDAAGALKAKK